MPDHPRACGANHPAPQAYALTRGSSPRMRGKPIPPLAHRIERRIIPAHAGQTAIQSAFQIWGTDHPRACGANTTRAALFARMFGSSPRMRGKPDECRRANRRIRIIPAHAGQTPKSELSKFINADHPRACGANRLSSTAAYPPDGSSPRMRGKPLRSQLLGAQIRIIPAHAGQTVRFYAKTLERWTLNNWIRTVAPIFVLLFLPPVIGQNAYIERHYSNQSFSWFSKLHYASAFDLSLVA